MIKNLEEYILPYNDLITLMKELVETKISGRRRPTYQEFFLDLSTLMDKGSEIVPPIHQHHSNTVADI
jgi:hypothetical protein